MTVSTMHSKHVPNFTSPIVISIFLIFITYSLTHASDSFKINKINMVWKKAQHKLGPTKLKDLKRELTEHEKVEVDLKHLKATDQDKDGIYEATVRRSLLSLLKRYSLEHLFEDIHPAFDKSSENSEFEKSKPIHDTHDLKHGTLMRTFRDKRLDKLWRKAEKSDLSEDQLMILYEEFQHQQDKLEEHYATMNDLEEKIERSAEKLDAEHVNSLESDQETKIPAKKTKSSNFKEASSKKKTRKDDPKYQHLHDEYKQTKKQIEKLHDKISGKEQIGDSAFEEPVVEDLWNAAKSVNFSDEELKDLKDELTHYQIRVKKLKHFETELERRRLVSKATDIQDAESKTITKKVKDLTDRVDKSHRSFERRIQSRHDEL